MPGGGEGICVKVLPRDIVVCFDAERATLEDVINQLISEYDLQQDHYVLVNDSLVSDKRVEVRAGDKIVLVEEYMGG